MVIHCHIFYGHQTWQGDDLPRRAITGKFTQPVHLAVLQDHVQSKTNMCTTAVFMGTKRGRMVTYLEGVLPIKLPNLLFMWSCKAT